MILISHIHEKYIMITLNFSDQHRGNIDWPRELCNISANLLYSRCTLLAKRN